MDCLERIRVTLLASCGCGDGWHYSLYDERHDGDLCRFKETMRKSVSQECLDSDSSKVEVVRRDQQTCDDDERLAGLLERNRAFMCQSMPTSNKLTRLTAYPF